ncbi:MAG TPA: glycosyltransferase [Flavobacteriales bacterium]|nr:glycosyltransferase [Flavobacteriales bacterium]HQV76091.1 glycosyltransferase [Flavobacteriales bacterium]
MKLSVIIVNYNVRAYLEQCLCTVEEALHGIDGDVFVVDNQSTDGSVEMVRSKFPNVKLIANTENVGFSRANNQAIRLSNAEHVVLLNPDTVVGEDVFRKALAFMDEHHKIGGLGVKMIDGKGNFLPESKRGLPTPAVAFYKIIGLTRLFPHSKIFGRYHLGHLPENEHARIEILSGACMFLRMKTLNEVGLLDESFFMYGEDIDLSYRITLGGYENWYLPQARIIHYKGESTKKSSVNYVFVFYNAMAIFAKKHFTQRRTDLVSVLINGSIYLSAAGAIVARFLRRSLLPMLDLAVFVAAGWTFFDLLGGSASWPVPQRTQQLMYMVQLLLGFGLMGAYDLPVRMVNVAKGALFFGMLSISTIILYPAGSLVQGPWTAFVAFILLVVFACSVGFATRVLLHLARIKPFSLRSLDRKRVLAVGSTEERDRALALLWQTHFGLGRQEVMPAAEAIGPQTVNTIRKKIRDHGIDEVVFCAKDIEWGRVIELMEALRHSRVMFKIAQPSGEFIIGPNSIESLNDLFIMDRYAVYSAAGKRTKRFMDLAICAGLLVTAPVSLMFMGNKENFLRNWWAVLGRRKSWVGYGPSENADPKLPTLEPGVLDPLAGMGPGDAVSRIRINIAYAKDYNAWNDLRAVLKGFPRLGGT